MVIYVLLDPASKGSFIKESILQELQVNAVETQLKLNTMHGSEVVPTRRVGGLTVERMDREVHIELPKAYSRNEVPSKRNKIQRPEATPKSLSQQDLPISRTSASGTFDRLKLSERHKGEASYSWQKQ